MITSEQRQRRRRHLGASDSAAIVGLSRWKTPRDVWFEKVHELQDHSSTAIALGNYLEPVLLSYAAQQLGVEIVPDVMQVSGDHPVLAANYDGLVRPKRLAIEAKTRGIMWPAGISRDDWGPEGSDQVPADVWTQCQHQALVGGLDEVYVISLVATVGLRMYRVPRAADQVLADLAQVGSEWWLDYVAAGVEPEGPVSGSIVRSIVRQPGSSVDLTAGLIGRAKIAAAAKRAADQAHRAAQTELIAAMGSAEIGTADDGSVTYQTTTRRAHTVAEATYRTLRIKEIQNGKR